MAKRQYSITLFVISLVIIISQLIGDCDAKRSCNMTTVRSDTPLEGSMVDVNGLQVYESKDNTSTRLLFVAYSITRFRNPNIRQIADKVAQAGFRIAMPDFHAKGLGYDTAKVILKDLIPYYKSQGVTQFGIYGYCWGGPIAMDACTELEDVKAGAMVHPVGATTERANNLKSPMFLMPSRDEGDMIPFYNIMEKKFGKDKIGRRFFEDMGHGFSGDNFDNPLIRRRVVEQILILRKYFNERLPK